MIQGFENGSFPSKSTAHRIVGQILGPQHLHGHLGSGLMIDRFVDVAHRAVGDLGNQLIAIGKG